MTKYILIISLLLCVASFVFPQSESGFALGFSYDFAFNRFIFNDTDNIKSFLASPNFIISSFGFSNENILGFFVHGILLGLPRSISYTINDISEKKDFESGMQMGFVLGPAFRFNLNDLFILHCGIGLNFLFATPDFSEYIPFYGNTVLFETSNIDLGIGGDIQLRWRIERNISLNIGTVLTFDFFRYINIKASDERLTSSGIAQDFLQFRVRPYISISFNHFC